jgi:hypothetical protein
MIKGKPIVAAISVACANSFKSLLIPNVSYNFIVHYNIVRNHVSYLSRKIIVVMLYNAPCVGVFVLNSGAT